MHPLMHIDEYRQTDESIKRIWEQYIHTGNSSPALRNIVINSWNRCRQKALPVELRQAPKRLSVHALRTYQERSGFFLSVATPLIKALLCQFQTKGLTLVLTDNEGTILHEEATPDTIREFDKLNFTTGAIWSEAFCGTNAIGTALTTQTAVTIFSAEHYCEGWHHLVCTATPVNDPYTGISLGIIDLTGKKELLGAHNFTLVHAAKTMIEQAIEHEFTSRIPLTPYHSLAEGKEPVVVFTLSGKITRCSRMASILFNIREGMNFRNKFRLPESSKMDKSVKVTLHYTEDGKDWEIMISPHIIDNNMLGGIALFRAISGKKGLLASCMKDQPILVAHSTSLIETLENAKHAANFDFPVLITGSTGTGKERIAQHIHEQSPRCNKAFIPVNCGAIPRELIASELFGHMPGAFTGADPKGKKGKFVQADKGILFLDEIADLPMEMQPYLLRILEEKIVYPLGSEKGIAIDVRIIAATHKNLMEEVAAGRFREDLYYRLNVINLQIPDLKERPEDILPLFRHFMEEAYDTLPVFIQPEVQKLLLAYPWPGNVRELKNAAEHAVFRAHKDMELMPCHLPEKIRNFKTIASKPKLDSLYAHALNTGEQITLIRSVLEQTRGNISKAARLLHISRMTLYRKMKHMMQK